MQGKGGKSAQRLKRRGGSEGGTPLPGSWQMECNPVTGPRILPLHTTSAPLTCWCRAPFPHTCELPPSDLSIAALGAMRMHSLSPSPALP